MKEKIRVFRYKVNYWSDIECGRAVDSGYAFGTSMGDAADRIESVYTSADGDEYVIDLYIYEADGLEVGVLTDGIIADIAEEKCSLP